MKTSALLVSILALSLTACGSREVKETVIEKPVVTREVVIERQQQPRSCTYGNTTYSSNSMSCQGGYQYQCTDGTWTGRNVPC